MDRAPFVGARRGRAPQQQTSRRRPRGGRCLVGAALVVAALRGLGFVGFASPSQQRLRLAEEQSQEAASGLSAVAVGRRGLLGAALLAGPTPAQAIFGIGDKPNLKEYTVGGAFNISFPPEFEVLQEAPEGLVMQGDRIQQQERMTAAAKVVNYATLAAGWGANITEVGERLAAKRPSGAAELGEAKADPTGQGLDVYQFEFLGEKLAELWVIAVVKKGNENYLCNVACRTPRLLWDAKREQFKTIMESFKPLENQTAAVAEAVSVS